MTLPASLVQQASRQRGQVRSGGRRRSIAFGLPLEVIQGATVLEVLFEGERATGVRVRVLGRELTLRARYIVDASGRRCLLGKQLGLWEKDTQLLRGPHAREGAGAD